MGFFVVKPILIVLNQVSRKTLKLSGSLWPFRIDRTTRYLRQLTHNYFAPQYRVAVNFLISCSKSAYCSGTGRGAFTLATLWSLSNRIYLGMDTIFKYSVRGDSLAFSSKY